MHRASGWVAVAAGLVVLPPLFAGPPAISADADPPDLFPGAPEAMPATELEPRLPRPSLREPFSIGEALYDPSRVADAVVSLLDQMRVPVVADLAAADAAPALTLSEAEVSALIAMGREDAAAAGESDEGAGPFTFVDLHAMVAPFLGGMGVEQLAGRYARAYESRPDDLAPAVMMGQPILPETPLTRVQIWLLLVDGFASPPGGGARRAALDDGAERARTQPAVWRSGDARRTTRRTASGGALWGTANAQLPPLEDPSGGWKPESLEWMVGHLLLVGSRIPFALRPASAVTHEGHGGPGQRLTIEARLGAAPEILAGPMGPILIRRSAQLAGCAVDWQISDDDVATFQAHGALQASLGAPTRTDASGAARMSFVPKKEAADGQGTEMSEVARVHASIVIAELLRCAYDLPANARFAQRMLEAGVRSATAPVEIGWHSHGIDLRLTNTYDVGLDFGALGKTKRWGLEGIRGSLAQQADGSYRGVVRARSWSGHVGGGLGKVCPEAESDGKQWLVATATPVTRLNANQDRSKFAVTSGQTDGGYLELTFKPATGPAWTTRDACQDADELLFTACGTCPRFLPFNDARWTTPEHAFVIAIPRQGKLVYKDRSLADLAPPAGLGPFRAIIKGTFTSLQVEVERTDEP